MHWRFSLFLGEVELKTLPLFIRDHAVDHTISLELQLKAAQMYTLSVAEVEKIALERNILPARYQRNRKTISTPEQLTLFTSRVAVVGCGGLGGYIIEELARLGVGNLVVVDPDIFEEHNLNRQLLSKVSNLGKAKTEAAKTRIAEINPAVTVMAYKQAFTVDNGEKLLDGCNVVVDALDSMDARYELSTICARKKIPLVHGAIAGWYGYISTQKPGDELLENLYASNQNKGLELQLGNPSFTPAVVASLQTAEVCKLLLQKGECLCKKQLAVDLFSMDFTEIPT